MSGPFDISDGDLALILKKTRRIAVVGASNNPDRPSFGVMRFLLAQGYDVVPVNPGLEGQDILGQVVFAQLADVPCPIDMVDIFRASDAAANVVRDAIALKSKLKLKTVWMQIGVISEDAARAAQAAKLKVVMDRCPKIEIPRLGVEPKKLKVSQSKLAQPKSKTA